MINRDYDIHKCEPHGGAAPPLGVEISLFPCAWRVKKCQPCTLRCFLNGVRDGRWEKQVQRVRPLAANYMDAFGAHGAESEKTKAAKSGLDEAKKVLSGVTLAGAFASREKDAQPKWMSGVVALDLDCLPDLDAARRKLKESPHILACWLSCSGRGVWVIAWVESLATPSSYRAAWETLSKHVAQVLAIVPGATGSTGKPIIDPQCCHASRLCFVSYDPDLWLNEKAIPLKVDDFPKAEREEVLPVSTPDTTSTADTTSTTDTTRGNGDESHRIRQRLIEEQDREERTEQRVASLGEPVAKLYRRYVQHWRPAVPAQRNSTLVKLAASLIRMVSLERAKRIIMAFYDVNCELWTDSRTDHEKEMNSALEGALQSYAEALPENDRDIYGQIRNERRRDVFRVLRGMAFRKSDRVFPCSQEELALRIGFDESSARDALHFFSAKLGVTRLVARGSRRTLGAPGIATQWKWLLSVEEKRNA